MKKNKKIKKNLKKIEYHENLMVGISVNIYILHYYHH